MAILVATPELLVAARAAYHALMTGTSARVVVDQNGERVEYTAAKKADLYAYIMELDAQINPPAVALPVGPARFFF